MGPALCGPPAQRGVAPLAVRCHALSVALPPVAPLLCPPPTGQSSHTSERFHSCAGRRRGSWAAEGIAEGTSRVDLRVSTIRAGSAGFTVRLGWTRANWAVPAGASPTEFLSRPPAILLRERDTTAFAVCALFGGWVILFSVFVGCLCTIFCAILRCSAERAFEMRVRGPVTDQFAVLQRLLPLWLRVRPGWPLAPACMSSTRFLASPPLNWPRRKLQLSLGQGKSKIFFLFPSSLAMHYSVDDDDVVVEVGFPTSPHIRAANCAFPFFFPSSQYYIVLFRIFSCYFLLFSS